MKRKHLHRSAIVLLGAALLIISGCVGGTSKPSTFYLLKALPESEAAVLEQGGLSLEVGPITVPAYLDRTQIASTGNDHKLYMDEFHRWAEPLKDSFGRVLADNLAILLKTVNVYQYRQRRDVPVDFQVEISVSRFFADADGTAVLAAFWSVAGNNGKTVLSRKRSSISEKAVSKDFEAVVAAQNKTLQELSKQVAAEIQKLR
jgi:uncharacterized lipoprotein YmbA